MDVAIIIWYSLVGFLIIFSLACLYYWRSYYYIYDHRLLFVVGLVFSRSLAYYAIVDNLMWYFTDHDVPFVKSTVFSNIQEALSSLFVIFMAHSADSFVGRFRTILFSTTAFICGIMLLLMFNPYDVTWLIVIILVLLALGRSGDYLLQIVLADLVNEADKSEDQNKKRSDARAAVWRRIPHASGAISATLWVAPYALGSPHSTWNNAFFICLISMTTTLMIFCKGHGVYHQGELTHRPVEIFFRVIRARIHKLLRKSKSRWIRTYGLHYIRCSKDDISSHEERNIENEVVAVRPATGETKEQRDDISDKEDMKVIRSLLRMFPLWGTFFVVSLTSAVGSTFYIEQYDNLENKYNLPVQIYNVVLDFSFFAIPFLYDQLTCFSRNNQKLKIGVGMLCSILSCVFAWQLEVHRQRKLQNVVGDDEISISVIWLVPQFVMLGFMEGLTQVGLLKFFRLQVEKPVKNYGEEYMELVMCLGRLANIVLVLIFSAHAEWFLATTKNVTLLNMYYLLMVCVCSVNLVIYSCVAICFYKDDTKQDNNSYHNDFHRRTAAKFSKNVLQSMIESLKDCVRNHFSKSIFLLLRVSRNLIWDAPKNYAVKCDVFMRVSSEFISVILHQEDNDFIDRTTTRGSPTWTLLRALPFVSIINSLCLGLF